jgi:CRISPR-associated protein Cas2
MTVLVANDTPPTIRGILKRWFVEPKPNVIVGTVNRQPDDPRKRAVRRPDLHWDRVIDADAQRQ